MIKKILLILSIVSLCFPDTEHIECEQTYSIDEVFFNEDIVGYYIAAFDLTTGSSNVLMFDYAISTSNSECYLPGDFISLTVDFEIDLKLKNDSLSARLETASIEFTAKIFFISENLILFKVTILQF